MNNFNSIARLRSAALLSLILCSAASFAQTHNADSFAGDSINRPSIAVQPSNITVFVGENAVFTVSASGATPLLYQWKKDKANIPGATNASFALAATTADSGARYRCAVSNGYGAVLSNFAVLNVVRGAPVILAQPQRQTINEGNEATFSVMVSGSQPLAYRWQRNRVNIAGATNPIYSIQFATMADSGASFRCIASNAQGAVSSEGAILTVMRAVIPPVIAVEPTNDTLVVGDSATFSLVATGTPPLTYQWRKNGVTISGATNASYTTPPTTAGDANALFRCIVSNSAGHDTSVVVRIVLRFPARIIQQPSDKVVGVGDNATFTVRGSGTPRLHFHWLRNDSEILHATDSILTITSVTNADSGALFRCVVSNLYGTDTSAAAVLRVVPLPTILTHPANQPALVGETATFFVVAGGEQPLLYQWQKNGTNISGATDSAYTTVPITLEDDGASFRCVVSNVYGSVTSNSAVLSVTSNAPAITHQPLDVNTFVGHSATFVVTAIGSAPLQYEWYRNNVPLTGSTDYYYIVASLTASDSGASFSCVVSNAFGTATSNSAILHVVPSPLPSSDDFSATSLNAHRWTIVNPKGDSQFSVIGNGTSDALLSIDLPGGVSHDLWNERSAPRLMQSVPDTSFEIEIKIQSNFSTQYQGQGIVVEQDSMNMVRFDAVRDDLSLRVFFGIISVGVPTVVLDQPIASSNQMYLRLRRANTDWFPSYSSDGSHWTELGGITHPMVVSAVGVHAINHNTPEEATPPFTALYDYFFNTAAPIIPEDPVFPPLPPTISVQPRDTIVNEWQPFALAVVASGSSPLWYQWQRDGLDISGATSATYNGLASSALNGAAFRCIVRNPYGIATSRAATITVLGNPPAITRHPNNATVLLGSVGRFAVAASGSAPLFYQWLKDGEEIHGATSASYITPPTSAADSGSMFRCVVSNGIGAATSNAAMLNVVTKLSGTMRFVNHIVDEHNPRHTHCKAIGDIDGDGYPDILGASAKTYTDGLYWYRYPAWEKSRIDSGSYSTFMQVADIDADGDLDAVITKGDDLGYTFWWYENPQPLGNPARDTWNRHYMGAGIAHDLEVGDINGDGKIDVIGRYADSYIFLQVSPDEWQLVVVGGRWAEGTSLADLDGDGDLDILNNGAWQQNPMPNGDITNPAEWNYIIFDDNWESQVGVGAADLDGDGRTDVLLAPSHNQQQMGLYWFKQPDSVSGEWLKYAVDTTVNNIHNVEVADMNNDGFLDIVCAEMYFSQDPDEVNIYLGDGTGHNWVKNTIDYFGSHTIYIADIGNDGDLDLMGANADEEAPDASPIEIWENLLVQPKLSLDMWERHVIDSTRDWQSLFISAADVDHDMKTDIITGAWWYKNPGTLSDPWMRDTIGSPLYNMAVVHDFDLDGYVDVLGTQGQGPQTSADFVWARNLGNGHFSIMNNIDQAQGNFLQGAVAHRFGIDSRIEVAFDWDDQSFGVQKFTVPDYPLTDQWQWGQISTTSQGEQLTAKDIDRDRNVDLMLGTKWLKSNEWQEFTPYDLFDPGSDAPDRNRVADINGDDRPDVVVGYEAISSQGKLAWYEQPSSPIGLWTEHIISTSVIGPMSLDVADMDRDGDYDVIVGEHFPANPDSARLIIFENADNIGSLWEPHIVYTGDEHHDGAQVVDIDGDGDLDIISISWANGNTMVYENTAIDKSGKLRVKQLAKRPTSDESLPKEFALSQNYPNPFNPTTTIRYDVPNDSKVILQVFNLLGQEVTTLVNEEQKAGRYTLRFDSSRYASGVYFYRMQANSFVQTKKMIVVR